MALPSETVTLPGSGLTFVNTYTDAVSAAYRSAVITAENFFQSHFTDAISVGMTFDIQPIVGSTLAQNQFSIATVGYASFAAALRAHATTADDILAVNGLPASDPSGGQGFGVPMNEARLLGLALPFPGTDDIVTLNSGHHWSFGQDVVAVLEHEMSEGVFGRVGSLGTLNHLFDPTDLFRFTTGGVRDFTGGADGQTAVFGLDPAHLTSLIFHNSINAAGVSDFQDLADWQNGAGDAFAVNASSTPGTVSATDLRLLDILGWTPTGAGNDTIQGTAGPDIITTASAGPTYLRGNEGDDLINGGPGFDDINGNMGNDTAHGNAGDDWVVGGKDQDVLFGDDGDDIVLGNLGNDTLDGGNGNDVVRGGQGDDSLTGGPGNDFVSGDRGNDTMTGGPGADNFHSSQDAGIDKVLDFNVGEGDRVQLDPGTTFTVVQQGADTVIDMGGGNEMILVGVQMSTLPPGTIFLG